MIEIKQIETSDFKGLIYSKNSYAFGLRDPKTNEYFIIDCNMKIKPLKMIKCNGVVK